MVLKASQVLSSEIQLDQLLATLLEMVLENSGADRATLLMPHQEEWFVEAIAKLDYPVQVAAVALTDDLDLPLGLIHKVKRDQRLVVLTNAGTHSTWATDRYIVQQQPKSLLCMPIMHQGKLVAILYLENRVTAGVFTCDRIELLNILCTQAAISLENAKLYAHTQENQRQLQTLLSNLPGIVYSSSNDEYWTIKFISAGCFHLTGYYPEEILNNHDISYAELIHPEDTEMVDQAVQAAIAERRTFQISYRIKTKQGEEKWVWEKGNGVFDPDGNLLSLEGLVIDISDQQAALRERQAAETALAESEAYHRHLLEHSAIGFALCRLNGDLIYANQRYCHIVGRTFSEVCALTYWDLTPITYAEAEQQQLQDLQTRGCYGPYEKEYIHKDGHRVPVRLSGLIVDYRGEQYIWSNVEDISDLKANEAVIVQKTQALAQVLQDLQNAQLQTIQNEKMASLGNLVAGVAHEINNPIGFLNGSINNARDYVKDLLSHLDLYQQHYPHPAMPIQDNAQDIDLEFLSEDLPKLLDAMKGATNRIKGISTSLRTFSRADTEHKINANLHEGLDSTLLILKYRLKANEFRPAIEVVQNYGDLPAIDCFPGQLNQVFMNIIANAIDMFDEMAQTQSYDVLEANPQKIIIQTEQQNEQVLIHICDNGKGMDEAIQAKIFDHLFTTKAVGKGTGLGLAIARQIVEEKHEGTLEVLSTVGQGTEFCIRLPIYNT
jgi:PAS domain S-box-containing protein